MHYTLGNRANLAFTAPFAWKDTKSIEGVIAYVRDESTGQYVRVYDYADEQYVQGVAQSYSWGNFGSVEEAKIAMKSAYNWINKRSKKAA